MLELGRKAAATGKARMRGDASPLDKHFDGRLRESRLDALVHQGVRDAVIVVGHLHVVIDVVVVTRHNAACVMSHAMIVQRNRSELDCTDSHGRLRPVNGSIPRFTVVWITASMTSHDATTMARA